MTLDPFARTLVTTLVTVTGLCAYVLLHRCGTRRAGMGRMSWRWVANHGRRG